MRAVISALAFLFALSGAASAEMRLMMGTEEGCMWCARWQSEIGPIYPKTVEGQRAPLWQVDIHDPLPDGVSINRPFVFTPTFILLEDGKEIGRIEGYPGEDFFWGFLENMMPPIGDT